ncbi:MAG: glycosyltransferase [Bacteroidia bacterium]|nr:glycosyltransferase [Bacteroidia bacterium]
MAIKVCHITTVHQPFDNRIFFKECASLRDAGYAVSLICAGAASQEREGITIIGFPGYRTRMKRFFKTSFVDAYRVARNTNADIYHLHDPELVWMGLRLLWKGKMVIMDVHENNAAAILSRPYVRSKFLRQLLSLIIKNLERILLPFFSGLITARPDISALFPHLHPVTLRNFPVLPDYDSIPDLSLPKSKLTLIYVGGATAIRGTRELIRAMALCDQAELWILGPFESGSFRQECEQLEGWNRVKYLGVVEASEIFSYIKAADIGVITFLPVPNHVTTLATKPFEYMACGLPVIMSNFPYWKDFFGDSALYVDPADPADIAAAIRKLSNDHTLATAMRRKNLQLARTEYNWQQEKKGLLELYHRLSSRIIHKTTR